MEPELADLFARLEYRKAALLAQVRPLSEAQMRFRPSPGAWSVAEVLDHVYKMECEILETIRANQGRGQAVPPADRIRGVMLTVLFRSPFRLKVPPRSTTVLPNAEVEVSPLLDAWAIYRKDLAKTLAGFPQTQRNSGVFAHPVSGWMTLNRSLLLLSAHSAHHSIQIDRLKSTMTKAGIK
jgi:uncharacterized damage-inducible protein DinB